MKKVKLNKKLVLNKETISKLNDADMNNVKGGTDDALTSRLSCLTIWHSCACTESCLAPICIPTH